MNFRPLGPALVAGIALAINGCAGTATNTTAEAPQQASAASLCESGRAQSPVDFTGVRSARLRPIGFDYRPSAVEAKDGHLSVADGGAVEVYGERYSIDGLALHAPAQHALDGYRAPLELDLLHRSDSGTAVIGLVVEEGQENAALEPLLQALERADEAAPLDLDALLPEARAYYAYSGSLTAPPCTEGVKWMVLQNSIEASPEQIVRLSAAATAPRPLQPVNGRALYGFSAP